MKKYLITAWLVFCNKRKLVLKDNIIHKCIGLCTTKFLQITNGTYNFHINSCDRYKILPSLQVPTPSTYRRGNMVLLNLTEWSDVRRPSLSCGQHLAEATTNNYMHQRLILSVIANILVDQETKYNATLGKGSKIVENNCTIQLNI